MSNSVRARRVKHPLARWRWWQVLGVACFSYGIFGLMIGFFPAYSSAAIFVGMALATVGVVASLWNWRTYDWQARFLTVSIWSLMLLALSVRSLTRLISPWWVAVAILGATYLLSWALPVRAPTISALLWREQSTPQTRIGRWFLAACIALLPIAGVLGANIGMFGNRFGQDTFVLAVAGLLGLVAALAVSFAASYQLWPLRPWANRRGAAT